MKNKSILNDVKLFLLSKGDAHRDSAWLSYIDHIVYPKLERYNRDIIAMNSYIRMDIIKNLILNCTNFESYSRAWRKVLEKHPELRGPKYQARKARESRVRKNLNELFD